MRTSTVRFDYIKPVVGMKKLEWVLLALASTCVFATSVMSAPLSDDQLAETAQEAVQAGGAAANRIHHSDGDTFRLTDLVAGGNGTKVVTFERTHRGIPVRGDIVRLVYAADGSLAWAGATIPSPIEISSVEPRISHSTAEEFALSQFPYRHGALRQAAELVIYASAGKKAELAWYVRIDGKQPDGAPSNMIFFVSADRRAVLGSGDETKTVQGVSVGRAMNDRRLSRRLDIVTASQDRLAVGGHENHHVRRGAIRSAAVDPDRPGERGRVAGERVDDLLRRLA